MTLIGAFDAKTQLSDLLNRVQAGEEITITKRGKPVARLVPAPTPDSQAATIVHALRQLREEIRGNTGKVSRGEIRKWINEGRR